MADCKRKSEKPVSFSGFRALLRVNSTQTTNILDVRCV